MRLPVERFARPALYGAPLLMVVSALAACGHSRAADGALATVPAALARSSGPAADYPVVIGQPYKVGATLYTPADTMNYDEVGHVAADGGAGVTGSHHTLPLPSYVEVTSLVTGKTILVRLERRGPMAGDAVVALAPAALAQLGASAGDPVRVRRVNPPEEERAALRQGRTAPPRMETPPGLVAVLKRKLAGESAVALAPRPAGTPAALTRLDVPPSVAASRLAAAQAAVAAPEPARHRGSAPPLPPLPSREASAKPAAVPSAVVVARLEQPAPAATPAPARVRTEPARQPVAESAGAFVVQAAAMSTIERAKTVAAAIDGSVSRAGKYYRVRTGPFTTRQQAEASLAKVRAAGYSDARISTNG